MNENNNLPESDLKIEVEKQLNGTLANLEAPLETNFAGENYGSVFIRLSKINTDILNSELTNRIKFAITLLLLVLYPQLLAAQDATVSAPAGLKLRTGPSTNSSLIQILSEGSKVRILNDVGDWDEVDIYPLDGKPDGYVYEKYLNTEKGNINEQETGEVKFTFNAQDCNNGNDPIDSRNSMCYTNLMIASNVVAEGYYAHNYTSPGKKIAKLKIGDVIQINKDNGIVLKFKVISKRLITGTDARNLLNGSSNYVWTTNKALENNDPHAKIVFDLTPY